MRFRILGPLEVGGAGGPEPDSGGSGNLTPRAAKIRVVLAALLVRANEIVSVDTLIDELWGEEPPRTATTTLQVYVSQLRKLLDEADAEYGRDALVTRAPGYELRLDPAQLDLTVFQELYERGQERMEQREYEAASRLQRQALALWRGPLLSDTPHGPLLDGTAVRMTEVRTAALEQRIRADLHLGRQQALIGELQSVVAEFPLREEFFAHLMVALYRSGRQADALQVFARLRRGLVEELGIDPGLELQTLHRQILGGDPELLRPTGHGGAVEVSGADRARGPVPGAGPGPGTPDGPDAPAAHRSVVELPAADQLFTGREEELGALAALLAAPGGRVVVLGGQVGVGKTALATEAAHRAGERFPGGRVLLRMRPDAHEGREGLDGPAAVARIARLYGAEGALPGDARALRDLLRGLTGGRRLLVVLDSVDRADQVEPVAAALPEARFLVTCRRVPPGLDGRVLLLDVPAPRDARRLLVAARRGAGAPDEAEATEIAELCGQLPLALRAAARAEPCAAARFRGAPGRLAELDAVDPGFLDRLGTAYEDVDSTRQREFRLLGLLPEGPFGAESAAAVLGTDATGARAAVAELVAAGLVREELPSAGRPACYRLSEPLRLLAADRLAAHEPADSVRTATGRLCAAYEEALREVSGQVDGAHSLEWLARQRPAFVTMVRQAARSGLWEQTVRLTDALTGLLETLAAWDDWESCHRLALDAAHQLGDLPAQARLLRSLGDRAWQRRELPAAGELYERALLAADIASDLLERSRALTGLADLRLDAGAVDGAAALLSPALDAAAQDPRARFEALRVMGLLAVECGRPATAEEHFGQCLSEAVVLGDARLESYARRRLAALRAPAPDCSEVRPGVWRLRSAA
ncbi:AAA family ATPase [Streptomyces sp. SID2563]|uniref:AfsR/SARP family transcriptional regulator n=1 Tax=Streptomyces sp. SID2563 TaxID=2690255 RepID=UPI00136CC307|nr:AfsR/SARP family transcriptional regulator [Streptomyces sp. SID2563]MYW07195.1 AAA family ATPase [Streptomyces sp. SID2563]